MTCRIRIHDEGTVQALVDVPLQRNGVAVVEVAAKGFGLELVDEFTARKNVTSSRDAVHPGGVDAMEVHRVWVRATVPEDDPDPLALDDPDGRAGDAPVV